MKTMLLDVQNLTKRFEGTEAITVLDDVCLTLSAEEAVALTGESGSGKSTLIHIIAGLEPPDAGRILFDGRDIAGMRDAELSELRRQDIGVVFQQFNLIPSLNVSQNITFQARLAGKEFGFLRLENLVEDLALADQLEKYPEQLSGGQQQRVAILRALLPAPRLVLADEPTGNLDEATADAVFDALIVQTRNAGAGLLIATHSERLAGRADRRLHLSHGKLQT